MFLGISGYLWVCTAHFSSIMICGDFLGSAEEGSHLPRESDLLLLWTLRALFNHTIRFHGEWSIETLSTKYEQRTISSYNPSGTVFLFHFPLFYSVPKQLSQRWGLPLFYSYPENHFGILVFTNFMYVCVYVFFFFKSNSFSSFQSKIQKYYSS